MSVNVIELIRSTLPEAVVRQLSNCLGLPPEATAKVVDAASPALVAGLLNRCATLDGARALFATILGQEVNADIGEQLPRIFASTTGVTQLSSTGRQLLEHTFERRIDGLSDTVSMQTGVPAHATHAVTGIAGSILMGVLKRHLLAHQGNIGQLPTLLGQQLPVIAPHLNDSLTTVLGLGGASAFVNAVGLHVRAVSAHFERPAAAPASARDPAEPAPSASAAAAAPAAQTVREVRYAGPKAKHWFGAAALSALLGAVAAMLMWVALAYCPSAVNLVGRNAVAATAPTIKASPPADAPDAAVLSTSEARPDDAASATGKIEPQASATAKDARLIVAVDKHGKPAITATVQNVAEKSVLLNALTAKFGAGNFNADVTVDDNTKAADWLAHIDALLPLMQTPGAGMKIGGTRVELSGAAADAKAGWPDRLNARLGATYQVSAFDAMRATANETHDVRTQGAQTQVAKAQATRTQAAKAQAHAQ
ncbi:OmpA/MotB domain-containing protein (fragment) [Paraburkholderia piptadeniae]|uniref:OmpA/MotB domain-containing protein n=1 Tax=Paraburkholderia piptadeniae TaxID=1701573 RepID=A0A1N7SAZ2_9BURK